jgi:reactive intermediate/imine deaminase
MPKRIIATDTAPQAIGTYSQAVEVNGTVYISGQIPLDPQTMQLVEGIHEQIEQVFKNLEALTKAAGGSPADLVKLTIFLTDLNNFATVNEVMAKYIPEPYPARAAIEVSGLPKGAEVEIEGIMMLDK